MPFPLFKKAVPRPLSTAAVPATRPDRYLRIVLTVIAVALWANLLQPLLRETAAWAQKGRTKPAAPATSAPTARTYSVVFLDKDNHLVADLSAGGSIALSPDDLATSLDYFPKHGWRVHSIIPYVTGGGDAYGVKNYTKFVLLLER